MWRRVMVPLCKNKAKHRAATNQPSSVGELPVARRFLDEGIRHDYRFAIFEKGGSCGNMSHYFVVNYKICRL